MQTDPVQASHAVHVAAALARSLRCACPFAHWLIEDVLPSSLCRHVAQWPAAADAPTARGRRETINASRRFVDAAAIRSDPQAAMLALAFDSPRTRSAIATLSGARLAGTHLRIEHAVDRDGFWLEPHTDIGAKRLTLLIFLSQGPGSTEWGTDLYDADRRPVGRTGARFNRGLLFLPGNETWHGFERRPIHGLRRTLIVNYVGDEWRARHELVQG